MSVGARLSLAGAAIFAIACQRSPNEPLPGPLSRGSPIAQAAAATVASASPGLAMPAPAASTPPAPAPPSCGDPGDVMIFASPEHPWHGGALRVVAVSDHLVDAHLVVSAPDGTTTSASERHGGPPYAWFASVEAPATGAWRATLSRDAACGGGQIRDQGDHRRQAPRAVPRHAAHGAVVHASRVDAIARERVLGVDRALFDAPLDAQPSWNALHEVLRDPARNFLFDHLGRRGRRAGRHRPARLRRPSVLPPRVLRVQAGAPFGWSRCSRGGNGVPPVCPDLTTSSNPFHKAADGTQPTLPPWADPARSGTCESNVRRMGRVLPHDAGRRRPVRRGPDARRRRHGRLLPGGALRESLRPGTIFADPTATCSSSPSASRRAPTSGGVLWRSTGSPTAPSHASASGAATSSSRSTPRWAAQASSVSVPSSARGKLERLATKAPRERRATRELAGPLARTSTSAASRASTTRWTTSCPRAPLDPTRAPRDDRRARGAGEDARQLGRQRPQVPRRGQGRRPTCPTARRSSRRRATGRTSRRPRATCACSSQSTSSAGFRARVARRPERYAMPADRTADASRPSSRRASRTSCRRASSGTRAATASTWSSR